ncbi:MAG: hypothetical protein KGL39_49860 [Patescibacteria group bacterium]|nr:hypothetical protein [Patescibacteria group bacterium]
MTLDEMKLAVCEKLPELIHISHFGAYWHSVKDGKHDTRLINWPTEGLQVCHEAEKMLDKRIYERPSERCRYVELLETMRGTLGGAMATYEQRLEALCRVWFPHRF